MRNSAAIKERLADEPDAWCNMPYMEGYRLGEDWVSRGTTSVAELTYVGKECLSLIEIEAGDKDFTISYMTVVHRLTHHRFIGGLFRRYMVFSGIDYDVDGIKGFEQGFLDAVRIFYKNARGVIEDRMLAYHNNMATSKKQNSCRSL